MPKRYNINPIKDFDLTEVDDIGPVGVVNWGQIGGTLSNQTDLQSALDSKVNDTGDTMTGDLAFTNAGINNANQITFNTGATETITEGVLTYNQNTGNLELGLAGGNTSVAIGKGLMLPRRCLNQSGTTMTKGTVVYISGVSGNNPVISRALATSDATSAMTIGLTAEDITDGHEGWIVFQGELAGLNLSTYTAGDTLYLSGTNAGEFTKNIPQAPIHYVRIGIVTKATASGEMIVNIINGFELQELQNVQIKGVATGQILQYQTDGLWKNVTLSGVITNHNSLQNIQGGTTNEYYHLTNLEHTTVQATSGTNTGDITVTDTQTVNLTLSGQLLMADVNPYAINFKDLGQINIPTITSGQLLQYDGTNFVNTTPLYPNFYGKYNTDPSITGVRDGDQYWNNLDSKMQVYISEWRELNGPERFKFQDDSLFQMQNNAYFQFQD